MAFPLIQVYTGEDGESHFEEGTLQLPKLEGTAHRSRSRDAADVSFETRLGETCTLAPGTILLAEESEGGGGHRWRLTDGQPWRRVYVVLE
jgi:hypothetical protein